jgi:dihydroneopterin aldolase
MDKIVLAGLEFYAYGGVSHAEREIGQRYRAHIELQLDLEIAARTDDLNATISYAEVTQLVLRTARSQTFQLLESLTARIADAILATFPVAVVTVQVQKLLPPVDAVVAYAAIELTRTRHRAQG